MLSTGLSQIYAVQIWTYQKYKFVIWQVCGNCCYTCTKKASFEMCFETSSSSSFTVSSFLCMSHFPISPLPAEWSLQPSKRKCWVFPKDTQFLVFKRLLLHSAQQVQALCNSCFSPVTDNVLMWGCKSYLQYVLVWHYLLGDQNNLDAFCSWLCLQDTYCFLLWFLPQGEGHASQLLCSYSRKNIKISAQGKQEK